MLYEAEDDDDASQCSCGCGAGDDAAYEVTCPTCGTVIGLNEDDLSEEGMVCPNCGENLEFDYDEDELDDDAAETEDAAEGSDKE